MCEPARFAVRRWSFVWLTVDASLRRGHSGRAQAWLTTFSLVAAHLRRAGLAAAAGPGLYGGAGRDRRYGPQLPAVALLKHTDVRHWRVA